MTTRTDRLQVSLEAVGNGKFKAELSAAAEATRSVGVAANEAKGGISGAAGSVDALGRSAKGAQPSILAMAEAKRQARAEAERLAAAQREEAQAIKDSERSAQSWGATLRQIGVGAAITAILKQTVETIATYDALDARLERVTRSQQGATDAMVLARAAVEGTAISVVDMGNAYAELRDGGITPTLATLNALANLSVTSGQSVAEAAQTISEAAQGNIGAFEKLGISATQAGNDIVVSYEGVTSTIENTQSAIVSYLESIGAQSNAAARDAETLGGAWQDLKNEASELVDALSDSGLGGTLTDVVQKFADATAAATNFYAGLNRAREGGNLAQSSLAGFIAGGPLGGLFEQFQAMTGQNSTAGATPEDIAAVNARAEAQRALNDELALGQANLQALAAADAQANAQGELSLQRMTEQLEVAGKSRAEAIEYAAAQVAATVADAELARRIVETGRALAEKARQLEASRKATGDHAATTRALREELREGEKAYRNYMREMMANEDAMIDGWHATDTLREAVEKLDASFDPAAEGMRKMLAAEELLEKAYKAGVITLEQYDAILSKVFEKEQELGRGNKVSTVFASFTGQSEEDASRSVEELGQSFSRVFGDAMINGFDDIDERLGDALKETLGRAFADAFQKNVIDNLTNAANGGEFDGAAMAGTAGQMGGAYLGGQAGGGGQGAESGAMAGAMVGAQIGSIFGPIGTVVGAVLGGIIGGLIGGMGDDPPEIDARGPNAANSGAQEGYAIGPYGRVGVTTTESDVDSTELAQAIVSLDASIASLLTVEENRRVRDALADFSVNNAYDAGTVLSQRLNEIIQEVEPGWYAFLMRYEDVQERASAFGALRGIENQLENIQAIQNELDGSSLEMFRDQLDQLDTALDTAMDSFRSAWESGVTVDIESSAAAAMQALVDRYNTEIKLVNDLQAAIEQAAAEAYQLNLALAQRISGITGDYSGPVDVTAGRVDDLRASVAAAQSAQQALTLLTQFVSAVDAWVSARTAQINAELNAGLASIERQRTMIAHRQAAQQRINELRQKELEALQEQLRLANEWLDILQRANAQQQAMQFGQENPLGGFGRLDAINQAIAQLTSGDLSELTAEQAGQLLDLLQQRLQLIQSEGLFDRPSDDYLEQYNQTLAMIDMVRGLAEAGSEDADDLQQQIEDLQALIADSFTSTNSALARLSEQEETLRAQAQAQMDEMNQQALEQYEWARGEAEANQDVRTEELRAQLEELTGGLDIQEFIALRQAEAVDLLAEIESNLREFMAYVTGQTMPGQNRGDNGAGGGGGAEGSPTGVGGTPAGVSINVTIDGRGMSPADLSSTVQREMIRAASVLRNELRVA